MARWESGEDDVLASPPSPLGSLLTLFLAHAYLLAQRLQVAHMRELTACRHLTHSLIHSVRPRPSVRPSERTQLHSLPRSLALGRRPRPAAPRPSQSRKCRGEGGGGNGGCRRPAADSGARVKHGGREEDVMYVASSLSLSLSLSLTLTLTLVSHSLLSCPCPLPSSLARQ